MERNLQRLHKFSTNVFCAFCTTAFGEYYAIIRARMSWIILIVQQSSPFLEILFI